MTSSGHDRDEMRSSFLSTALLLNFEFLYLLLVFKYY